MADRLNWKFDGRNWPNRETSQFVVAGGLTWHVQVMGSGPALLLLHGTGAATHSWRDLAPILAKSFTVIAPDLPGHGFSSPARGTRYSLPGMSTSISMLLKELEVRPVASAGHSAGAAILAYMHLEDLLPEGPIFSLNGALLPLRGIPGSIFSPIAKALSRSSVIPWLFAWRASDRRFIEKLLRDTGSSIDRAGMDCYVQLARSTGHVSAALSMMANWDLSRLHRDIAELKAPLVLIVGSNDRTVSPNDSRQLHKRVDGSEFIALPNLGHLAHEEDPEAVAKVIFEAV